jgi:SAM-dependent methyltransferase
MSPTYDPTVFNVNDIAAAMRIILTPEDSTTEERWRTETPYLADLIDRWLTITPNSVLLDYGCGIGRIAKELIARHGCRVIGVDISPAMRALAPMYVQSERFFACPPAMLDTLIEHGPIFDGALSIWVLQHCLTPADDIVRTRRALRPDARLFVLNNIHRAVPTKESDWVNDGLDVRKQLGNEFVLLAEGAPAREATSPMIAQGTFWAAFRT